MGEWARANGIPIVEAKMPVESAKEYEPFFQILTDGIKDGWCLTPENIDPTGVETDPLVYGSSPETMAWVTMNGTSQSADSISVCSAGRNRNCSYYNSN